MSGVVHGTRSRSWWMTDLRCISCNHRWEVKVIEENGIREYADEDAATRCPDCGLEEIDAQDS